MDTIGYIGALLIGITLGFLGGGGSILAVPIFVYLLGISPITATAYSLFVVGSTSVVGTVRNYSKGMIDLRTGIVFAIPALIAVYLTRKSLIPFIPDDLFSVDDLMITKDIAIMVFFAIIMLLAAISMIRGRKEVKNEEEEIGYNYPFIIAEGAVVGVLTGIVGAGGGFLIIPALVLFAKLPMKKAVGTSLMIISIKSLIGFIGDVQNIAIDWVFLLLFTAFSIVGILIGIYLSKFISNKMLKKVFGYFVLLMAAYILMKELVL
ncbi:MAG: putative membrane protein YfcA [Maribacter sp.]|jgi:uncharacterized membrane protein YfcA